MPRSRFFEADDSIDPRGEAGRWTKDKVPYKSIFAEHLTGKVTFDAFGEGLRPIETVDSLPTLPHADYPEGAVVFLTTDDKLYRSTGSAWTVATDGGDITAATITGDRLVAGTIQAAQIAANTITANEIAANTITAGQIAALTITAAEIAADTITAAKIAANTITAAEIAANTITAGQIAALTITAAEIAANTITAAKIAANTITATEIAAGTITATEIAAGTITATEIAAGTITATEIATNTITADRMNVSQLSAIAVDAGTLTAGKIQDAGATPTRGILISGTLPATWTNWVNLVDATKAALKIGEITINWDGTTNLTPSGSETMVFDGAYPVFFAPTGSVPFSVATGKTGMVANLNAALIGGSYYTEVLASDVAAKVPAGALPYVSVLADQEVAASPFGYDSTGGGLAFISSSSAAATHLRISVRNLSGDSEFLEAYHASNQAHYIKMAGGQGFMGWNASSYMDFYTDSVGGFPIRFRPGEIADPVIFTTTGISWGGGSEITSSSLVSVSGHTHVEADITDLDHYTSADFSTDFATKSTTNLSEGTNLYFTNARADARIALADLDDLADVVAYSALADDEILQWNTAAGGWRHRTLAEAGISATGHTHAFSAITGTLDPDQLAPTAVVGDLYYAQSVSAVGRLGIGTEGYILSVISGLPAWVAHTVASHTLDSHTGSLSLSKLGGGPADTQFCADNGAGGWTARIIAAADVPNLSTSKITSGFPWSISEGGTNATSLTADYVLIFNGTSIASWVDKDTIPSTSAANTWTSKQTFQLVGAQLAFREAASGVPYMEATWDDTSDHWTLRGWSATDDPMGSFYFDLSYGGGGVDANLSIDYVNGQTIASGTILSAAQKTDLTDSGASTLHYHASDRNSANFTGTNWTDLTDGNNTTLHKHAASLITTGEFPDTVGIASAKYLQFDGTQAQLSPTGSLGSSPFYDGIMLSTADGTSSASLAAVIISTSAPSGDYPYGTIWCQYTA